MPRLRAVVLAIALASALAGACSEFDSVSSSDPDAGDAGSDGVASTDGPIADAGPGATDADADADADAQSTSERYRAAVLADDPRVYWRMGRITLGTNVPDETVGNNALELTGSDDYTTGAPGIFDDDDAIRFGGQSAYGVATVSALLRFDPNAPFTIEMWARRELRGGSSEETYQSIASFAEGHTTPTPSSLNGYLLFLRTGASEGTYFDYGAGDAGAIEVKGRAVPVGVWAHHAVTMDGGEVRLYVDGELQGSLAVKGPMGSRSVPFTVAKAANESRFFCGFLDEIAIYPRALTGAQLAAHYKIVRP